MKFTKSPLPGAFLIDIEPRGDERGFFARLFCEREFGERNLETVFVQANDSLSAQTGTLRGMHYQLPPADEVKVVRCISGAVYDVVLDLRPESPTFGQHFGAELSAANRTMMYAPRGFAHGFLTLAPDSEVLYLVSASYAPELERGIRYDDPRFGLHWPIAPRVVSGRDRSHPDFDPAYHLGPTP